MQGQPPKHRPVPELQPDLLSKRRHIPLQFLRSFSPGSATTIFTIFIVIMPSRTIRLTRPTALRRLMQTIGARRTGERGKQPTPRSVCCPEGESEAKHLRSPKFRQLVIPNSSFGIFQTARVFASVFSMGVPVNPMNDPFGRANSNSARDANTLVTSSNEYLFRRP